MILKRVGPMSLAKVSGVLYAIIGFIIGCFAAAFSLLGQALGSRTGGSPFGALFGVGAVILFPVMYGVIGFIASLIGAAIYNLLASWVGGVEVQLDGGTPTAGAAPGLGPSPGA